jgi:PBSX family phage terminase large subunit
VTADILPLSKKQRRALARSRRRVNILEGSIRAGKTWTIWIRWLTFIAADRPKNGALIITGRTLQSIYRNLFEPLDNDPALAVFRPFVQYRLGAPTAVILGQLVHVVGASDARAESKIRGFTVAGALVEEVTTLPPEFFRQLLGRMSPPGAALFGSTNPDSPTHWFNVEYLERLSELPDWYVEHFTMDDNPGLTEEYKRALKQEYTGVWYDRFIKGLWVVAEGTIYGDSWDAKTHIVQPEQIPPIERVIMAALDYGDVHPTRAYLLGLGTVAGQTNLYVLDEFAPGKGTVAQRSTAFLEWLGGTGYGYPEWIAYDPAASVFKTQLQDDGLPSGTTLIKAHNSVLSGIQTVDALLSIRRLFVSSRCPHLIKMLPGYRWDPKAEGTKPIKEADDEADALRYVVYTSRRYWRHLIPLRAAQGDDAEDE